MHVRCREHQRKGTLQRIGPVSHLVFRRLKRVAIVNRKSVGIKLIGEKSNFTHDRHGIQLRDAIVQGTVRKLRLEEPPSTVEVADRVILRVEYHVCFLPDLPEISIYVRTMNRAIYYYSIYFEKSVTRSRNCDRNRTFITFFSFYVTSCNHTAIRYE